MAGYLSRVGPTGHLRGAGLAGGRSHGRLQGNTLHGGRLRRVCGVFPFDQGLQFIQGVPNQTQRFHGGRFQGSVRGLAQSLSGRLARSLSGRFTGLARHGGHDGRGGFKGFAVGGRGFFRLGIQILRRQFSDRSGGLSGCALRLRGCGSGHVHGGTVCARRGGAAGMLKLLRKLQVHHVGKAYAAGRRHFFGKLHVEHGLVGFFILAVQIAFFGNILAHLLPHLLNEDGFETFAGFTQFCLFVFAGVQLLAQAVHLYFALYQFVLRGLVHGHAGFENGGHVR